MPYAAVEQIMYSDYFDVKRRFFIKFSSDSKSSAGFVILFKCVFIC